VHAVESDHYFLLRRNDIPMAKMILASLKKLAREKRGLLERERQVAHTERRVVEHVGRLLSGTGYRLVPVGTDHLKAARLATATPKARVKRLRCPKCDRRFAHPLPMARHMSATHGTTKTVRKAAKRKATRR
jgi:uncharacterized C2H2 Zn-finger protein